MRENNTLKVNLKVQVPPDLQAVSRGFQKALSSIDTLYVMQTSSELRGSLSRAQEKSSWVAIISTLSECLDSVPQDSKEGFKNSLQNLKGGIYDLYPLKVKSGDKKAGGVELILGKVFLSAGGGQSYYSGVCGRLNNNYDGLIESYDGQMPVFAGQLGALAGSQEISAPENIPELKCLNVFSLAGGLNLSHKPICVFFSGGGKENVSSLSNMTVFINLYSQRFKEITHKIAEQSIPWAHDLLGDLGDDEIARLLLLWLRGHDIGHFFGADNLGKEMSEFDMDYMILHELKSDYISLFNLRHLDSSVLHGITIEQAYAAAVTEMFRYIRRGGVYKYPDSGSAYLTYMALTEAGALKYDKNLGTYSFDTTLFEKAVSDRTKELLNLFSIGNAEKARAYVNRWGSLAESDQHGIPKSCPEELLGVINDPDIARQIEYDFEI